MSYLNVGVKQRVSGERLKTKSALKKAIKDGEVAELLFDETSSFNGYNVHDGGQLPTGVKFSVVGPCPYTARNWYATVEVVNGKVKVS